MNNELERTEELLAYAGSKGKRKKLVAVIIATAVFALGIGVFAGIKIYSSSQLKGYLKTAEADLKEGKYTEAIASYEKVIKIDDKNAAAYEGLGDANMGLGDTGKAYKNYKKAKDIDKKNKELYRKTIRAAVAEGKMDDANKIIDEMHKNIEGTDDVDISSVSTGSTQENMMAGGIVCQDGDTLYIANKPERGSITKVDKDGKEKVIFKEELGENESVRGLNVWNGWLYYGICDLDQSMPVTDFKKIKKVRTDGTESKPIDIERSGFTQFAVVQGKLYWLGTAGDGGYKITRCDLDGKNTEEVSKEIADTFVTDGVNIYYSPVFSIESYGRDPELRRININTGKEETVFKGSFSPFYVKKDTLYGFGGAGGQQMPVYALDLSTGKRVTTGKVGYAYPYNVNDGKIIWSAHSNYYIPDVDDDYNMEIRQTSLSNGKEEKPITHAFTLDEMSPEGAKINGGTLMSDYQVIGDKLYYCMQVSIDNGYKLRYGCMNIDGSDNEVYN